MGKTNQMPPNEEEKTRSPDVKQYTSGGLSDARKAANFGQRHQVQKRSSLSLVIQPKGKKTQDIVTTKPIILEAINCVSISSY
jgi:hypothetical protein